MAQRFSQLAFLLLAAIIVAGMGLSAQGYGATAERSTDCCCAMDRTSDTTHDGEALDASCCPTEPDQSEEDPCSCACSGCNAMVRTVNLFSVDTLTVPLFASDAQLFVLMPDSRPASAVLGVDIQPPIA